MPARPMLLRACGRERQDRTLLRGGHPDRHRVRGRVGARSLEHVGDEGRRALERCSLHAARSRPGKPGNACSRQPRPAPSGRVPVPGLTGAAAGAAKLRPLRDGLPVRVLRSRRRSAVAASCSAGRRSRSRSLELRRGSRRHARSAPPSAATPRVVRPSPSRGTTTATTATTAAAATHGRELRPWRLDEARGAVERASARGRTAPRGPGSPRRQRSEDGAGRRPRRPRHDTRHERRCCVDHGTLGRDRGCR